MTHIPDDDLVLLHYGELEDGDARQHLAACAECRARLDALTALLGRVDSDYVPEPAAGYEDAVWNRLRWKLGRSSRWNARSLRGVAAAAALIVIGFFIGRYQQTRTAPLAPTQSAAKAPTEVRRREGAADALELAAARHFDRSSRLLLEVANDRTGKDRLAEERVAAGELLASNRLYRTVAAKSGAGEVADLLEEIEPILLELAHSANPSAADLAAIQQRIAERELVFKLRVIRETLRRRDAEARQVLHPSPRTPLS